jgi:hypothetical protein
MVYVCFFVSLFLICSYVVLRTFFHFIRKLTYDFTFPVHILRFHWDFFYFMRSFIKVDTHFLTFETDQFLFLAM